MWKKQPNTMEMTYSTIVCTSYGFYFFLRSKVITLNYDNYYHLSLSTCISTLEKQQKLEANMVCKQMLLCTEENSFYS